MKIDFKITNHGRKPMEIHFSSHFGRAYLALSSGIQKKAEQREYIFRVDPFDTRLKTHKLRGKLKDFWSFSVDRKYRIVFRFATTQKVVFLDIGDHDIYK